jgi:membrane fusion protein, multidrug efflux system
VPQQAVSQGPQGTFVYVVNANSAAEIRAVKLDREVNNSWVVREGLNEGDRIIIDGVMRVRPNAPVKASPYVPKAKDEQPGKAADAGKPAASEAKK